MDFCGWRPGFDEIGEEGDGSCVFPFDQQALCGVANEAVVAFESVYEAGRVGGESFEGFGGLCLWDDAPDAAHVDGLF